MQTHTLNYDVIGTVDHTGVESVGAEIQAQIYQAPKSLPEMVSRVRGPQDTSDTYSPISQGARGYSSTTFISRVYCSFLSPLLTTPPTLY